MIKCEVVENAIREAMEDWLKDYTLQINSEEAPKANPVEIALETVRGQLAGLLQQQENICEYLEKGIYTVEMFNNAMKANPPSTKLTDMQRIQRFKETGE